MTQAVKSRIQPPWLMMSLVIFAVAAIAFALELRSLFREEGGTVNFFDEPKGQSVLFIGNSFTFYNDMPKLFGEIVKASDNAPLKVSMCAFPGYSLRQHLEDKRTQDFLRDKHWDYVVLQDFSRNPIEKRDEMLDSCKKMKELLKDNSKKILLLETWADRGKTDEQPMINESYNKVAEVLGAEVIPVGEIWKCARHVTDLYASDSHHPSPAGSFLAAATAARVVLGRTPKMPELREPKQNTQTDNKLLICVQEHFFGAKP